MHDNKKKVVIVDDHPLFRERLARVPHVAVGRDNHHQDHDSDFPHLRQQLDTIHRRHPHIKDREVKGSPNHIVQSVRSPQKIHPAESYNSHIAAAKRYLNLRSFAMARINLIKALQLNTKPVEGFKLTGVLAEMLEDFDKARKYYGQAIKLDRNYEPARQNMRRLSHCNTSARARNFSIWEEREGAV
jgi:tetratricopeptide (TPR) repeat protein